MTEQVIGRVGVDRCEKCATTSYVYAIEATGTRLVVIGCAPDPWARLRNRQTGSPAPLRLIAAVGDELLTERTLLWALERDDADVAA